MSRPRLQPHLVTTLPALVIVTLATALIWGDGGLVQLRQLEEDLGEVHATLATLERDNQRLLRELHAMRDDPVVVERLVAEELGRGRPGTRLYRFDPPHTVD